MSFLLFEYPPNDYSLTVVIPTTVVPEFVAAQLIIPRCSESMRVYDQAPFAELHDSILDATGVALII